MPLMIWRIAVCGLAAAAALGVRPASADATNCDPAMGLVDASCPQVRAERDAEDQTERAVLETSRFFLIITDPCATPESQGPTWCTRAFFRLVRKSDCREFKPQGRPEIRYCFRSSPDEPLTPCEDLGYTFDLDGVTYILRHGRISTEANARHDAWAEEPTVIATKSSNPRFQQVGKSCQLVAAGDEASVDPVGNYFGVETDRIAMLNGAGIQLWSHKGSLVGIFGYGDEQWGRPYGGLLRNVSYDSASGRLRFRANFSKECARRKTTACPAPHVFIVFRGTLSNSPAEDVVRGTVEVFDRDTKEKLSSEAVTLKDPRHGGYLRFKNYDQWLREMKNATRLGGGRLE
jgi:hypothetical protein